MRPGADRGVAVACVGDGVRVEGGGGRADLGFVRSDGVELLPECLGRGREVGGGKSAGWGGGGRRGEGAFVRV